MTVSDLVQARRAWKRLIGLTRAIRSNNFAFAKGPGILQKMDPMGSTQCRTPARPRWFNRLLPIKAAQCERITSDAVPSGAHICETHNTLDLMARSCVLATITSIEYR